MGKNLFKCGIILLIAILFAPASLHAAQVTIQQTGGWFESAYVTWKPYDGATSYNVYVKEKSGDKWSKLDRQLVRQYPDYYRADALGLKAGDYMFKVEPVVGTNVLTSEATETVSFSVAAHDRSGFAHVGMTEGVGAYKNDGTLKSNAKVLYVWADNAKSVQHDVITNAKGATTTAVGLQDIIYYYQKGYDTTPLAIRIIGTIKAADMDRFDSTEEGLQVKGKSAYSEMPITIEGVGEDATIHGFGIIVRNCHGTEFRNFAIMLCMDDCLSIDSYNSNVWVHNMDFFYGSTGGDADQAKGDGTVDVKGVSNNVTVSYNHFYDSGKSSLGGMKSETTDSWLTYHHNWFDHSDSRHPRIRTMFFHVYNNYFDGNAKYGVGVTLGGSAFVESNYFRNCKYPMLIAAQGTDAEGEGTFSGESDGVIKAFNNVLVNPRKVQYNTGTMTSMKWDAILVDRRDQTVSATCLSGSPYNNEADKAARTTYFENKMDDPSEVPSIVKGELGAGRMHHGDFSWRFLNSKQDENYKVVAELKSAIEDYRSTLVAFADGTPIRNGGATSVYSGGDGKSVSDEANDAYIPSWGTGTILVNGSSEEGGTEPDQPVDPGSGEVIIGDADYFWFNESNLEQVHGFIQSGTIVLSESSSFVPTAEVASNGTSYSDKIGSLQLKSENGNAIFHYAGGITSMDFYMARTGTMTGSVYGSKDGVNYVKIQDYSATKGTYELKVSANEAYTYYKISNLATGSLHIQGVKMTGVPEFTTDLILLMDDDEMVRVDYYTLQGQRLSSPQKGVSLKVTFYRSGKVTKDMIWKK